MSGLSINWAHPGNAGLISHWQATSGSIRRVSDIAGRLHGSYSNGSTFAKKARLLGIVYDGVNDRTDLESGTANPLYTLDALTVGALVRLTGTTGFPMVYTRLTSSANGFAGVELRMGNSNNIPQMLFDTSGADRPVANATTNVLNKLVYISGSYDGATIRLYVNGSLEGSTATTGTIEWGSTPKSTIGARNVSGTYSLFFPGEIYAVRFSGKVLSQAAEYAVAMDALTGWPQLLTVTETGPLFRPGAAPARRSIYSGVAGIAHYGG